MHILRDGRFSVRALTRKPNGSRAKELLHAGATVVEANFDDLDSLRRAFDGCYSAFGITDYYEAFQKETQQGNNIVDAAKFAGLKHLVMSSAPGLNNTGVPSFELKASTYDYLQASGVPHTALIPVFYFGNMFVFEGLTKNRNGDWKLHFPFPTDVPIPSFSPQDTGAYALAAFINPSEWVGKSMRMCTELISPRQYAEIFSEVTGFPVDIQETTREQFMALEHEPHMSDARAVLKWILGQYDNGYPYVSTELGKRICPERQTWRDFIAEYREIPVPQPLMVECYYTQQRFQET